MKNKCIQSDNSINKLPAKKRKDAMLNAIATLKANAPSKESIKIGSNFDIYTRR